MEDARMPYDETAFSGTNCLIAGGLGFLGSNLAHRLVALDAHVHLIDALKEGEGGSCAHVHALAGRVGFTLGDICNPAPLRSRIAQADFLFQCTGPSEHETFWSLQPLLEISRETNPALRIVHAGCREAPTPTAARQHLEAQRALRLAFRRHGQPTAVLRLPDLFGPHMALARRPHRFLEHFLQQALQRGHVVLYDDGDQRHAPLDVRDAVDGLLRAAATPASFGRAFDLGHEETVTLRRLLQYLIDLAPGLSYELAPAPLDRTPNLRADQCADYTPFADATGWRPRIRLYDGLEQTLAHYERTAPIFVAPARRSGLRPDPPNA